MNISRRTVLLALGGAATSGGALLGTGAFSTVEAERDAQVEVVGDGEALLVLEPVPGEERPGEETDSEDNTYAGETDGGELAVNVDGYDTGDGTSTGVNPNAVTRIPEVFRIGNQGTQSVTVSITPYRSGDKTTEVEDVVFYDESDNGGAGDSSNVSGAELDSGDTGGSALVVGIDIDTTRREHETPGASDVDQLGVIEIEATARNTPTATETGGSR